MNDFAHHYYPKWKIIIKRNDETVKYDNMYSQLRSVVAELNGEKNKLLEDIEQAGFKSQEVKNILKNIENNPGNLSIFDIALNPEKVIRPKIKDPDKQEVEQLMQMVKDWAKKIEPNIIHINNLKKRIESSQTKEEMRDTPQSITISRTDHILSQATISFWDPHAEIFSGIDEGDMIEIEIGWGGAIDLRYRVQKVFTGIVTNKSTTLAASAGQTTITCHDERAVLGDRIVNDVQGEQSIKWEDFIKQLWEETRIPIYFLDKMNGQSSLIISKDQTNLKSIDTQLDAEKMVVYQEFANDGTKIFMVAKDDKRRDEYFFTWQNRNQPSNVISFTANVAWEQASEKSKSTSPDTTSGEHRSEKQKERMEDDPKERSRSDTSGEKLTSNTQGTKDDQPHVGNSPDPGRQPSPQTKLTNEESKKRLEGFTYTASLSLRGEPKISTRDKVRIEGISKYCDGVYFVKSVNHSVGSSSFTTNLELEFHGKATLNDIKSVFDKHFETNKYWGPKPQPHKKETNIEYSSNSPDKIDDYVIRE